MATTKVKTGIGVEITGDRINIVKLAKGAQGIVLVSARSVKLPIIKKEDDKKILSESVAKAFEGLNFEKDEITLGVGGNTSFVRRVKLPPVSYSKLKQVVSFEVQQQVPFSLNEVRWDYQVISPVSKILGSVMVLIAAIKQSFMDDFIKLLRNSINRTPDIVDTSSLALHNCLFFNDLLDKEKIGILINFGFSYTDVSIESKGELAFTRAVPIGRKNILKKIVEARNVGMGKAEEILKNEDMQPFILPVLEDLIAEIKRTTNYYLSQVEKVTQFQYILVSGEFPNTVYFIDLLKNTFKVETRESFPFNKIDYSPDRLTGDIGDFCVSTGLALRSLEHFSFGINLLPYPILNKKKLANKRIYFIASFVVLSLIGLFILISVGKSYNLANEKISIVKPVLNNYTPYISQVESLMRERDKIINQIKNVEIILKQKSKLSEVLLEVSKLTPSNIYITGISTTTFTPANERGGIGASSMTADPRDMAARMDSRRVPAMDVPMRENLPGGDSRDNYRGSQSQPISGNETVSSGGGISLSGATASYPTVDEYLKQLRTSPLFKTVDLVSVSSESGRGTAILSTPDSRTRGTRTMPSMTGESAGTKEKVNFVFEITLVK